MRLDCDAVVFDLDDTLLDHRGAAREALRTWAVARGSVDAIEDLEPRWQELEAHYYERFQAGELTLQEQRRARVRAFLDDPSLRTDGAADAAFDEYWLEYRAQWQPFPDAAEALDRALSWGVRVGVFTNGDRSLQEAKLSATGLNRPDLVFVASSELDAAKPSATAFREMQQRLGVADARRCTMVGDSWVNDIQGALGSGWQAVFLDRFGRRPDVGTVPRIRSLAELGMGGLGLEAESGA